MVNSSVPTLTLDGRNWKTFQANLLGVAAMKGFLGVLSGQEPDDESSQWEGTDALLKMMFYQTVQAPLFLKPNKLSVELPNEETLKGKLTEARGKGKAEAMVGAAQQTPSRSIKVEEYIPEVPSKLCMGQNKLQEHQVQGWESHSEMLDEIKNVDRKAKEDLPLKQYDGSTTNDGFSAHALMLEGEQAACLSGIIRQDEKPIEG
ncbi:hypothetical protein F5141DRAFT_1068083 [Pisolithus sp. B1]|nr:hypothetical protein F5141DRAFT_1068076 [Pisolithus sp. B1]KAI6095773.1 hypothetical protein F5141DRAFT_1068083 [Pisolithus sp. B1]